MTGSGITAEVKSFLYHWGRGGEPRADDSHFAVTVQVFIGESGDDLADSFDVQVMSPSVLAETYSPERWESHLGDEVVVPGDVLPLRGVWLMKSWSRSSFEAAVHRLVSTCSPGPDFGTVAARIDRVLPWEYAWRHDDGVDRAHGLPRNRRSFWHDRPLP